MNILITGGTGFVGRNLLKALLDQSQYEAIYLTIRNPHKLDRVLKEMGYAERPNRLRVVQTAGPDWKLDGVTSLERVVHLAGVLSAGSRGAYFALNCEGTLNLCRHIERLSPNAKILILSSQAASGPCGPESICKTERDSDNPVTWYGESKLALENALREQFSQLNYLCLRPPMVLGAGDEATLPLFKMAKAPVQFKPGFQEKHYSYIAVKDLVEAILVALDQPWAKAMGRSFFVASEPAISDRTLIRTAVEVCGKTPRELPIPEALLWGVSRVVGIIPPWRKAIPNLTPDRVREIWPNRWVISGQAFRDHFSWQPRADFKETLRETYEWYLQSGSI